MILAVDIGASSAKAALWWRKGGDPVALDIDGESQWSTALFLDRGRGMLTGVAPENLAGASRYRGRYVVGVKQQVNKPDPATEPLYRELRFPAGGIEPLVRGIGVILTHALTAVPKRYGRPDRLVLSHPVVWTDTEKAVLVEAAAATLPGVPVALVSEAEAVGLHMASRMPAGGSYAVLDFGASSFDFAVLRHRAQGPARVVYDGGRLIGGDDFDACLLNLVRESADAGQLRALSEIATTEPELLRAEAEQVKKALSESDEAVFAIRSVEIDVYRGEFEEAITPLVTTCSTLVDEALSSLLHADPPRTFALSGGAARIPLVRQQMADLAAGAGAKLIDAQEETPGSLVALGALRIPADAPAPRVRARRPFTLTPDVMKAPAARTPLTAVRGGLAFLGLDALLQVWQDDGTGTMCPVALRRKIPGSVAMTADGAGRGLVLASPSPAFTLMELNTRGEDIRDGVFGHLAATPSRSEGRVTALAHWWPLLAWCVDDGPGGFVVDGAGRWRPLRFDAPVSELTFVGPEMLLARTASGLFLLDTDSLRTPAFLPLSEPFSVAVEPSSATAAVSGAGTVSGYALGPDGFEQLWHRPLKDGGPVACTAPGGQPVVIVFDTHDGVYRALAADTGRQLALRDAATSTGPHRLYPSPDPGVVYARTPGFVHRLRLEGPVR